MQAPGRPHPLHFLLAFVFVACSGPLRGQSAAAPGQPEAEVAFEIASIKEARPPSPASIEDVQSGQFHLAVTINGSRADYGFMSLANLIPYAYRLRPFQLSGPSWLNETRWDILATIPKDQPRDRAPEMMRSLLTERFKLSIHRENREQSVYALIIGKGGLKITEVVQEEAPTVGGGLSLRIENDGVAISGSATGTMRIAQNPKGEIEMRMAQITMTAFADRLTQLMERPVLDATGLKGKYQVTLAVPVEAMNGASFTQKLAALAGLGPFGLPGVSDTSGVGIIQSVRSLGLELQSRKAPVETIIVDHVERTPTAN